MSKILDLVKGEGTPEVKVETPATPPAPLIEDIKTEEVLVPETSAPAEEEKKKAGRPPKVKETPAATEIAEEEIKIPEGAATLEDTIKNSKTKEDITEEDFWTDVEKLTGEKVQVNYEGFSPESPEGALRYINTVVDKRVSEFEDNLAKLYPKEYQALVLRQEGKDPSVLYKEDSYDYKTLNLKEDDEDTQRSILKQDLKSQGMSDKRIEVLVKSIFDSGDLYTEAQDSLKRLQTKQEAEFAEYQREAEESKAKQKQEIDSFSGVVNEVINKGQIGDFVINEKDKQSFFNFLADNVKYENGQFYAVVPLEKDPAKLNEQLKTEYFRFKKGNIRELVIKQAITENAKRLKKNITEANIGGGETKQTKVAVQSHKQLMGFK